MPWPRSWRITTLFNIVFVEPQIPYNTGALVRTCYLTNSRLHLIKPLGFDLDDKHLKRAGLDYWEVDSLTIYDSFDELLNLYPESCFYFATTKASKKYTDVSYKKGDFIVFGKETRGLADHILNINKDNNIKIPILETSDRSLNLANSANIILYEALRQNDFPGLK